MTLHLLVANFSILIFISKLKHLIDILITDWNWKVLHHELEISLGEEFILDFVLFCSEVCRIGISPTDDLGG